MPDETFDLPGSLRRIRRTADLSQRELARAVGLSAASVARAELGTGDLPVRHLVRAAACAGLRLALVDAAGQEITGMADDTVRDHGGRRFPAHLDTCLAEQRPARLERRRDRTPPVYTFDRDRDARNHDRLAEGTPADHRQPGPDDDPAARRARNRAARERDRHDERQRRFLAGELRGRPGWICDCPPGCDPTRAVPAEVHVAACPCLCDLS